jgi:hypothetical protein
VLDEPLMHLRVGPRAPDRVLRARIVVADHLDELVALDLRLAADDVVRDEPVVELRVGPARPDVRLRVVVVALHLGHERLAAEVLRKRMAEVLGILLRVAGVDEVVGDEPLAL